MTRLDRIIAYVDGELDAASRAAFEAEMAGDPALAADVALHRDLARRLHAAYAPVAEEPVPLALTLAAQAANETPRRGPPLAWAAGVAASLALGVLVGRFALAPEPASGVGDAIAARSDLGRALGGQLAAQPGPVRIGLSFRDRDGRWCRTFQSRPDALAGLACRDASGWRLQTATRWGPTTTPDYRTAATDTPPEVLAAVDGLVAGEVLDAAQERAARDGGWR